MASMIVGDGAPEPAPPPALTVAVHHRGDAVVVEAAGEVDILTAGHLQESLAAAAAARPPVLVIDLLAVTFLGSSGLAVLLETQQLAGDHTQLRVVATQPVVLRPLHVTGLTGLFVLCDSQQDALAQTLST